MAGLLERKTVAVAKTTLRCNRKKQRSKKTNTNICTSFQKIGYNYL